MDGLRQDMAQAMKSLLKAPRFTAMVVFTLALGIGANSAIFSLVDGVLLRPLPFRDASRVVNLAWAGPDYLTILSASKFQYWHDHARSLEATATWRSFEARVGDEERGAGARALRVSRDFFAVVGYSPELGRAFEAVEHVSGGPRVAIISQAMWRTRFEGSTDVLGRTLRIDGEPHTVVGVLPEAFAFPYANDAGVDEPIGVIVPLALTVDPDDVAENWPAIARLREGFTRNDALGEVAALTEPFRAEYPTQVYEGDRGMTLATFSELYVRDATSALWIMMGAVALVLLIACANVANLFLARAERRRAEVALRAALGATRGRVTRFILAESVLVALAAGVLGLPLAQWGVEVLAGLAPVELPRMASVGVDWRVLLFTFGVALATALAFGGAAAWPATRVGVSGILKESARGISGKGRGRQGLLVAQSALSTVLLVGAGLLVVTWIGLQRVDAGFDREGLVAGRVFSDAEGGWTSRDLWELQRRVETQATSSPAIASIAGASSLPFDRGVNVPISITGRDAFGGSVEWRAVTPSYFRTLGIPVVVGRAFDEGDAKGAASVAIVNESFARAYFPDGNAVGQRIDVGRVDDEYSASFANPGVAIVGVAADIREIALRSEPRRTMYVPQAQAPAPLTTLLGPPVFIARGRPAGGTAVRALAEAIQAADPALSSPQVFPFGDVVAASLARERFGATLLSVLAALALTLTAFGTYGVLAYSVRRRRREIGIRMALGAGGQDVTRMVVAQGLAPVLLGLLLGGAVAAWLSQIVAPYLWSVSPTDPTTFAAVSAILVGVGLLASWLPAREAVGTDPASTLSCE